MTEQLEAQLASLQRHIDAALDLIHAEALANLARLTRQVGQWTRIDRK